MATRRRDRTKLRQTGLGTWEGTQIWQVENTIDGFIADQDPQVPRYGQAWDASHPSLVVQNKDFEVLEGRHTLILCQYGMGGFVLPDTGVPVDPMQRSVTERWDFGVRQFTKFVDVYGNLVNPGSGYQALEPYAQLTIELTKPYNPDYSIYLYYEGRTNFDTFKGMPAGHWRCMGAVPLDLGSGWMKVTFVLELRVQNIGGVDYGWRECWYYTKAATIGDDPYAAGLRIPNFALGLQTNWVCPTAVFGNIYYLA